MHGCLVFSCHHTYILKSAGSQHPSSSPAMPFDMFKLFRNRSHRGEVLALEDNDGERGRRYLLKRSSKRKEPIFTPLPSRAPTDPEEEYRDGYVQVHSPSTVMGGTLNARPTTPEDPPMLPSPRDLSHRLEYPRLPHDDIPYAETYHEGITQRGNPDDPIVINHSSRSMSTTSSDRTLGYHRPRASEYPGTRIIPPPPRHRPRDYVVQEVAPANIYGSRHYDAHPEARGIHLAESYQRGHARNHPKGRPPICYIVPGGMNVVFQDERGRELTRVGDSSGRRRPAPPAPFIVQDPSGRELYRYDGSPNRDPKVLQIHMGPTRRGRSYSSPTYHLESYKGYNDPRYDPRHSADRRGYGRYEGYENHRNHLSRRAHRDPREYDDHRDRGDYRRHGDYSRHVVHEIPRNHGEHEDHRDYEAYSSHDRPELDSPVAPQGLQRTHSHSSHRPFGGGHEDLMEPPIDDRRSVATRVYEGSVHGSTHPEPFDEEITDRLDSLHMI